MLTDEERKALVTNKVRRSRETWAETKGIIENKVVPLGCLVSIL